MLQYYGHPVVKKNVTFFLIHVLHFKLHLMFNVNIPKDAARSGLSRYIPIIGRKANYNSEK